MARGREWMLTKLLITMQLEGTRADQHVTTERSGARRFVAYLGGNGRDPAFLVERELGAARDDILVEVDWNARGRRGMGEDGHAEPAL